MSTASLAQYTARNPFERSTDIDKPVRPGSMVFDPGRQTMKISVLGESGKVAAHWAYRPVKGDFILTAEFGKNELLRPDISAGWMVRSSIGGDSPEVSAFTTGEGSTGLRWNRTGATNGKVTGPKRGYSILQLERAGNTLIMRAAHPGEPLQEIGSHAAENLAAELQAGLFVSSTNGEASVTFRNIRIDRPVGDQYDADKDGHLGSRLELINIHDRHRMVIHESTGRFEAPNHMPDGKQLLFNQDGSLYTIPLTGGTPARFNTGKANRNNNDHVISFDGKLLGISHHREGKPGGGSTVYVLPIDGGEPRLITEETPSYLHGWSSDNKEVVYVAQRNGNSLYHLYKKRIDGGPEVQLTFHTEGHVDGPEYSPDGRYIYYNGSQSGTMQLWRMKPDGSGKEQLTFDERNNWFPHVSPDGRWIAYLSFPSTINPNDHPAYKRVTLNLMPLGGGAPMVIAYLYGGQGTINVPSWSPDSSTVAFVSNSERSN